MNQHIVTRAYEANRNLAALAERDAVVEFLRRQIALMDDDDRVEAVDVLRAVAACIEGGDHRKPE